MIKSDKNRRLYFFIKGWIKIFDGLISIVSFGFYWSNKEYKYTKKQIFKS